MAFELDRLMSVAVWPTNFFELTWCFCLAFGVPMVHKKMPPFVRGIGYMFFLLLIGSLLLLLI